MKFSPSPTDIAIASFVVSVLGSIFTGYTVYIKRPKIRIEEATLKHRPFPERWKKETVKQLRSAFMDFDVEMIIANYRAETGSITKPDLLISALNKEFRIKPVTKHQESEKDPDNPNITSYWDVRHGRSFILEPYGRADDMLKYYLENPDAIHFLATNSDGWHFKLEYRNPKGKIVRFHITDIHISGK